MNVHCHGKWRVLVYLALAVISATLLTSAAALANGAGTMETPAEPEELIPVQPSQPGQLGAGCVTSVSASNVGTNALIYTGQDWITATPEPATGTIQLFACVTPVGAGTTTAPPAPTADIVARFAYPATGGAQYELRFTCILQNQMGFQGVTVLKPVFGASGPGLPGLTFPQTLGYVTVLGNATIVRDGTTIAENQPAIVLVTQAIHDVSGRLLTQGDPNRREIHLVVPGPMIQGGTAVQGFATGGFYLYWPDAAFNIQNIGGRVQVSDLPTSIGVTPGTVGRGPAVNATPMPLRITITNTGIQKSASSLPAGLYSVTITNRATKPRGLFMTGTDICCTEFNRFSKILQPGQTQTFRFVFAAGPVTFRDMLKCERKERTCAVATYGKYTTSITFR